MREPDHVQLKGTENQSASAPSQRAPAIRVLAVDDERAAAKLLSLILAPPAFLCTPACSGAEALVALQRESFDAVISDLQMPGLSGLELLTEVRHKYPPWLSSSPLA